MNAGVPPTAMLISHAQTPPVPPSQRTELPIPASFDAVVMRCLAKSPGERPATAEVLAEALAAIDDLPAWTTAQARAWWDLNFPVVAKG